MAQPIEAAQPHSSWWRIRSALRKFGTLGVAKRSGEASVRGKSLPPWVVSTFACAAFGLSVLLLAGEFAQFGGLRPGRWVLASFAFSLVAAPSIHYRKIKFARLFVVPLAAVSGILTIARWPVLFADNPAGSRSVQALAMVGLAWLLAKLLLLQRFSTMYCSRSEFPNKEKELERLLGVQREYLGKLCDAIWSAPVAQGSRIVQLVGNWGQGKSFIIDRLGIFLQDENCAVVVVNVWEQQGEPDLHLAIVEQVLSHEKYWYPLGWLQYPLNLFLARAAKELRIALSAGKESAKAEVQIPLSMPRPTGRRYLEQQVDRVRKKGTRTVIVLDEIDRAAPRVAQSAMTFARRSLDMASVVVILSYVEPIIRYKVFNPLIESLPDLASTMHAVIFDRGPDRANDDPDKPMPGGPFTAAAPASLQKWKAFRKAEKVLLPSPPASPPEGDRREPKDDDNNRLIQTLRLAFANADASERRLLQKKFSERYLGTDPIQMRSIEKRDVADAVIRFSTIRSRVLELRGLVDKEFSGSVEEELRSIITSALGVFWDPDEPPTLRILEGELLRRFRAVSPKQGTGGFSSEFIAAVVVAAYDAAMRNMK